MGMYLRSSSGHCINIELDVGNCRMEAAANIGAPFADLWTNQKLVMFCAFWADQKWPPERLQSANGLMEHDKHKHILTLALALALILTRQAHKHTLHEQRVRRFSLRTQKPAARASQWAAKRLSSSQTQRKSMSPVCRYAPRRVVGCKESSALICKIAPEQRVRGAQFVRHYNALSPADFSRVLQKSVHKIFYLNIEPIAIDCNHFFIVLSSIISQHRPPCRFSGPARNWLDHRSG